MAQGITPHLSETRCAGPSQGTSGRPRRKCTEPGATRSEFRRRQRPGDAGSQISRSPEVCRPRTTAHGPGRTVHCYYDPMVGQSISPDPLVLATGYANGYAGEDPANGSDPSGWGTQFCGRNERGPCMYANWKGNSLYKCETLSLCSARLLQEYQHYVTHNSCGAPGVTCLNGMAGVEGPANLGSVYVNTAAAAPNAFGSLFGIQIPNVPCFHGLGLGLGLELGFGTSYKTGVASVDITPVG